MSDITLTKGIVTLWFVLLCLPFNKSIAQVISNEGAAVTITNGAAVVTKDMTNTFTIDSALFQNNGTINLSGNFTNNVKTRTSGNGTYRIGGNWTNPGVFSYGLSIVIFNGSVDQLITKTGGETFHNLSIENTGAAYNWSVRLFDTVTVRDTLFMKAGNVNATSYKLYLWNKNAGSLSYTSTTKSRVFGKFERGVGFAGTYLFPLGTTSYYNPARITTNTAPAPGSLISQFLTIPPGNTGLPLPDISVDPNVEVDSTYSDGYWSFTSKGGFVSTNYNIDLNGEGFIDTIRDITRIVKRISPGNWSLNGVHSDAVETLVKRNNLSESISSSSETHFALAKANPLIKDQPNDTIVCENTNPFFEIKASGRGILRYFWYKLPGDILIQNGSHYSGARTNKLTIIGAILSDAGGYYCKVKDIFGNTTTTITATLTVNKIPVATVSHPSQDHECSAVDFENIVLGESYGVPGTTYFWSRTNPSGINTTIPLTGTGLTIGNALMGQFTNITDAPITITFTITPVGPTSTFCVGIPVTATVTVNPRPRMDAVMKQICDSTFTQITLISPSTMTQPGVILFDYNITATAPSPLVGGNRDGDTDVAYGSVLSYRYTNNSDTIQSVFYNVTATVPALGCPSGIPVPFETKIHAEPLQNLIITQPLTCEGGSNAALRAVPSKGAGDYWYDWVRTRLDQVHGYNIPDLVNQRGGRWDVKITDNLNCKDSGFIYVYGSTLISRMNVLVDPVSGYATSCPGSSDGELWIMETNSSSGIPPFEYWITRNEQDTTSTDIHGRLAAKNVWAKWPGLLGGSYHLYIKDVNGCYNVTYPQEDITEPDIITVSFESKKYDGNFDISCKGYNDGSVWIKTITGGNGGYRYKWTTTDGVITGVDTLDRLDNIPAGTYYLQTTDKKGCTKTDSFTVTEPTGMVLTGFELSVKPDGANNVSCYGGSDGYINMTITGGSGNYNYLWTGPGGFIDTKEDISQLRAGVYNCTVRDLNGCMLAPSPSFTLKEPTDLTITSTKSVSPDGGYNISCNGSTGSVQVTVAGGITGTYQYLWSTSNGSGIVTGQEDQNSLKAGIYKLIVRDLNGCEDSLNVSLTQPAPISLQFVEKNITCATGVFNDGAINLTVSGGAGPFTYLWSNGAVTEDISGLTEGTYTVTVTDFNGCTMAGSGSVVNPPPLRYTTIISDYNGYNISCFGLLNGSIKVTTTSGTPPYIFKWTGPDGFTATTQNISGLRAGSYILNITDSLACNTIETIVMTEPGQLGMAFSLSSSTAGGYNINCAGDRTGYIGIEPLNQVKTVEYLWSDGLFGKTRTDLPAGDYSVIITDANNCYASATVSLTEPDSMKISFTVTQPFCPDMPDGAVVADVKGGVPGTDYTYKWSDNSSGNAITDITSGYYALTVKDLNGCTVRDSLNVEPVNESCLVIPNAISPNGDLINDEWNIDNIDLYPEAEVKIFNRWGINIWRSEKGYPQPWDGRSKGKGLPIDSYHYMIDLHNGTKPVIGTITIVR